MRLQFISREIAVGLRRNLTMTIAVIVTVMISLTLAGGGWLLHKQVDVMKGYWYDKVEVTIYLCGTNASAANCAGKDITQEQRDQLSKDLAGTRQVQTVFYESKDEAYTRFAELFKDSPDLVANIKADALPESFRVKLKDPKDFDVLATAFQDRPGVDAVEDSKKLLDPIFKVLGGLERVAYVVAALALLSATILISNVIRVAAYSRRRETGIMRLVGSSNLYIQLPFLIEGALAGAVGAVAACGLLSLGKWFIIDELLRPLAPFTNYIDSGAVYSTFPLMLLIGIGMSAAAAYVTLRRHLRV